MYIKPKIVLKIDDLDELNALLKKAAEQADELRETVEQINVARLTLQAKINQPSTIVSHLYKDGDLLLTRTD